MTAPTEDKPLPALRPELELITGAASALGAPSWLVHDPLHNRFLQIDVATYETLKHWRGCRTRGELLGRVNGQQRVEIDSHGLDLLITFLYANRLTTEAPADGWRSYAREHAGRQHSLFGTLVHNYLFFRVPLCRPQAILQRTLPLVRPLASVPVRLVLASLGLLGLYLVSREWDAFLATFQGYATWEGTLLLAVALVIVKAAHELGHAYTAVRYGCRVHSMGVAFVVMAPLLYTDVTDAWRLRDRRQRLAIDSAGIKVEIGIAAIALFLWAFLPEGPSRSLAFTLSVVSVFSRLAINLNPFMRFDGYYLLAELAGIDNLQSRAFELGRWKLREWLFGLGKPAPEALPRRLTAFLIVYAWLVWVYRLVLFVGIALLVYHYFFKLLGLILFAVEIVYFVARPIMNEIRSWMRERRTIVATRRSMVTLAGVAVAVVLCLVPWSGRVEIPAVVESAQLQPIYPVRPARIVEVLVKHGDAVRAGDVLARLHSPDIEQEIELAQTKLRLARVQYGRRAADAEDRHSSIVLESEIGSLHTRLEGLEKEREQLELKAPFDGRIAEFDADLRPGRWVSPKDLIGIVSGEASLVARGYVAESDLWRIEPGSTGRFVPEVAARRSVPVRIEGVATSGAGEIEIADLASIHSGRIAVSHDESRRLVPATAQYLVRMKVLDAETTLELSVRGLVIAEGRRESQLARMWRQVVKVLLRESGA